MLAAVADEITAAIADAIPEYRQPMGGAFGRGVRDAIEETLRQFLAQLGRPADRRAPGPRRLRRARTRRVPRRPRALDALQSAYRVGARVAWRRISEAAIAAGLEGTTLALLAESIFAYIDEISAESVEGYASAQAASAGERSRERQALVRLLVAGEPDAAEAQAARRGRRLAAAAARSRRSRPTIATPSASRRSSARARSARASTSLVCVLVGDPDAPGRARADPARRRRAPASRSDRRCPGRRSRESWARAAGCIALARAGVLRASA